VGTIAEQLALGPGAGVHAQYPGGAGHAVRGGGNSTYGTLGRAYGNELLIPLLGGRVDPQADLKVEAAPVAGRC
jgi:hypothetical protein